MDANHLRQQQKCSHGTLLPRPHVLHLSCRRSSQAIGAELRDTAPSRASTTRICPLQRCHGRQSLVVRAANITSNDFRPGVTLELDGAPWRVIEFLHVKPGKGAAFVRTKLKNYISGNVVERTFRAGESATQAVLEKRDCQFTYQDGEEFVFMDNETYEETRLKKDDLWARYIKEGTEASLLFWNGKVISVDPPTTMELEVTDTDPGVKGNTVSGGSKPATLETGATIQVPLFVNVGEKILVDTRTDTYLGRGKKNF